MDHVKDMNEFLLMQMKFDFIYVIDKKDTLLVELTKTYKSIDFLS